MSKVYTENAKYAFLRDGKMPTRELGLTDLDTEELVELRNHNVSPKFVRELSEMGFKNIPVDELVELAIHHVTPRFIREMRRKFGENLTLPQLLEMRIRGVDEDQRLGVECPIHQQSRTSVRMFETVFLCDYLSE